MEMRAHSKLPLDDDLIYRIFTSLPDFKTLQSFLATSKAIHRIYLTYPDSIVRAVAYELTGPALPEALRLIRYQQIESFDDQEPPNPSNITQHISPLDAHGLARTVVTVSTLEDRFSQTHKNRHASHSTLTWLESWRFHRAFYRVWLFSEQFTPKFRDLQEEDVDEINDVTKKCVAFIDEFADREVFEMRSIMHFLEEVAWTMATADGPGIASPSLSKHALMVGPQAIVDCMSEWSIFPLEGEADFSPEDIPDGVLDTFLDQPINEVLRRRQLKVAGDSSLVWKDILDDIQGERDQCEMCHKVLGLKLWSDSNWDLLRGAISTDGMLGLLKGRLRHTPDGAALINHLSDKSLSFSTVLQVIFDDLKLPKYESSEKHHPLCIDCLNAFLSDHLHLWLLDRRRKAGEVDKEDCWYGYNCRTQVHKPQHAQKLNHLCEPLKGDP